MSQERSSMLEREIPAVGHPAFDAFVATIASLRAPGGCPWDQKQTHRSIAHNMIEEAYEAVDAIERGSKAKLCDELGDVLLQVVLQSQIAADAGEFTVDDVCVNANAKIIRRHPHVFGDERACNASDVQDLWDKVKLSESDSSEDSSGLLDSVPTGFPALMQAQKISRKAVSAGFEWDTLDDIWNQVREETEELKEAYGLAPKTAKGKVESDGTLAGDRAVEAVQMEFGDVLFSLVNVARRMGIDSEDALRAACRKFRARWACMEKAAADQGRSIDSFETADLERLWSDAKAELGDPGR